MVTLEENDNLSKNPTTDTEQTGSAAKAASDGGSIPPPQTLASSSSSVKPPVPSTSEVAVEQTKDDGYQNVNLKEIEEIANTQDEGYVADVTTLGVADLQDGYGRLQSRSNLYKSRLLQIVSAYKEIDGEKEQLKVSISRSDEKHRRQISELKEQIHLDSQAKRDLENNYSLMLDEKDEMIQVLRMKIKLMKDESGSADGKEASAESKVRLDAADETQLKEKVKRLEALLTKCKDTIKGNKERIQQLATDRDAMAKQAQEKMDELEKFKEQSNQRLADLQSELVRSQKETTKEKSVLSGSTGQDTSASADQLAELEDQKKLLQAKVAKLEKAGQEQLEKSREIIRQLKEQKHHLEDEVKQFQTLEGRPRSEPTEPESRNTSEKNLEETEEALKSKIKELAEEIGKIKAESEAKLNETNSSHSSELTAMQEKLQLEHKKEINEINAEHEQSLTEVAAENEKRLTEVTKIMEMEFADKLEKQRALLEQQRIDMEKLKMSDDRELDEIRKRLVDFEKQVKQNRAELEAEREKGVQMLEEKKGLEERVGELAGLVDSQRDVIGKAETELDCLKHDLLTKTDEFNLTVKNYEEEIERLRKEVECKMLTGLEKNVPESSDSELKSMPTGFENIQQDDKPKGLFELKVEDEPKVGDEPEDKDESKVENESKVKDEAVKGEDDDEDLTKVEDESASEDLLKEKPEPSGEMTMSQIEMENLELKEQNKTLTDALEVERTSSRGWQDEIERTKADVAKQMGEMNQRLTSSSEMIAQLEQRMNDAMERENQLNMELETANIDNEQNLALRDEEIVSLQSTIDEFKNSEQTLMDANASQNETISSLQEAVDQRNASEQALNEKISLQSDEIKSLLDTIGQRSASEEALQEMEKKNLNLLSEKVGSLKTENEELKRIGITLEETVAVQSESIISLKDENEELRNSKQVLEETLASLNKSITLLETDNEELKNASKVWEETVASQSVEIGSFQKTVETLRATEQALKEEKVLTQNEEVKSLQGIIDELRSSEQVLKETNTSQKEDIELLKVESSQLKCSEQSFKERCASQSEELSLLQATVDEMRSSEQSMKDKNVSQSEELRLLQVAIDEFRSSEQVLKDKNVSQSEELSSLQATIDKLRSSEQALKDKNVSQSEELSLLQATIDELRSSEQVLKDKFVTQSEELSSLQATIDELRSSEQALKDKNVSQSEELSLLQIGIDELRSSAQVLKDKNASQSEELSVLQTTVDEFKSSEQVLKDENASQSEELSLLQTTVDELRSSEQTLKDKNASQSEELSLLQVAIDDLRSSEQVLKDKNISQIEEFSVLQATIDDLRSSEQVLKNKNISQIEEFSVLQATIDELRSSEQVLKDKNISQIEKLTLLQGAIYELRNSEQSLKDKNVSQSEELNLLQTTIDEVRSSEQLLKQSLHELEQKCLIPMEQTDSSLSKDNSVWLMGVDDPLYEGSLTSEQRPVVSSSIALQNIGLENETLDFDIFDSTDDSFKNSDSLEMSPIASKQQFDSGLFPSLDNVQKYVKKNQQKLQLECQISRTGQEEIISAYKEKGQPIVEAPGKQLRIAGDADDNGRDSFKKEIIQQQFGEDEQVLQQQQQQQKTLEESESDDRKKEALERDVLKEQPEVSLEILALREQVKHLKEEISSLKGASSDSPKPLSSSEIETNFQFEEKEAFQGEQTVEHLQRICAQRERRIKDLEGEVENYKTVHEKLINLERESVEADVNDDEEMALKLLEKENFTKDLEQMKIDKKQFEDELQHLKQEIETYSKINSTANAQVQQSTNVDSEEMIDVGSKVNLEANVGLDSSEKESLLQSIRQQYENEFDHVRTDFEHEIETIKQERDSSAKFYETRIADLEQTGLMLQEDLTILMEKLNATTKRCTLAEKAAEHHKLLLQENENADLKSQFKMDVELETEQKEEEIVQLKNELEQCGLEAGVITKQKLEQTTDVKQLQEELLTGADDIEMLTCVPYAENIEEESCDGKLKGTGTLGSSAGSANAKHGSDIHKTEFSAKFYEARIAELEETSGMLQEDLTIVMEKLNNMTVRCSQAEKAVEHYKQLVNGQEERDLKSQCQEDLEEELELRKGEIAQLKRELEGMRTESLKLSEKLMLAAEKEKSTRRLQTNLEEFEKCGAATVGGLEQQWLDVNNGRTSAGDVGRAPRENVHVEHFSGFVEGVPRQREVSDVTELNLLPFDPVPLQPVQLTQSGSELEKFKSSSQLEEVPVSLKEQYEKEFKKLKSDFKSELRQHAMENNRLKELQKELLHEVEVLKSSIQMSSTGGDVKLYVTEPTEIEYLRNILYKYMLGMETKTLAKVICTVVKFSSDQTRKVLEREESRNKVFFTEPR